MNDPHALQMLCWEGIEAMKSATRQEYERRVQRVQDHIRAHLGDPHSLESLARIAHFSPYHFHRVFRAIVGIPLGTWVRRERLSNAGEALVQTDSNVLSIALDAGYDSHEAFARAFLKEMGCKPSDWRRGGRATRVVWGGEDGSEKHERGVYMSVETKHMDSFQVLALEHRGDLSGVGASFQRLMGSIFQQGGLERGARVVGLSYDDPESTPVHEIRYDACVESCREGANTVQGGLVRKEVAGGLYASIMHVGAYDSMGTSYDRIFREWLPESGYEPREAPCVEIYISDPQVVPEHELRTEILIPLVEV